MEASTTTTETLPKFSRYRTVRQRAATLQTLSSQSDAEPPPPPLPKASTFAEDGIAVKRAPSRYMRNNANATTVASPPLPSGPLPKFEHATTHSPVQPVVSPSRYHRDHHGHNERSPDLAQTTKSGAHNHNVEERYGSERKPVQRSGSLPRQAHPAGAEKRYEAAREEARLILEGEHDRLRKMKRQAEKQKQATLKTAETAAPDLSRRRTSKHKDGRPAVVDPQLVTPTLPLDTVVLPEQPEQITEAPTTPKQLFKRIIAHGTPRQKPPPSPPKTREGSDQHTTGRTETQHHPFTVFDVPISAVNAGDRRVPVRYNNSEITLPVTPSTTAKDLLNSASIVLSSPPDPRTATLLEGFSTEHVSLERPIRRYERIRDILNSWNGDTQNHLFILAGNTDNHGDCPAVAGLDLKDVPSSAGRDITLQMYHSTRPSHWSKRWVRLREDGQVSISKHESGMDSTNICHLSDFDLYAPTKSMVKRLRPPRGKNVVFAVKSQQKSAIFLEADNVNFAHFFCSGNKQVADTWYAAVHGWRSWYLVNVMGEGRVPASGTAEILGDRNEDLKRLDAVRASQETVPYQLGSFKPLLDFEFTASGDDSDGPAKRSMDQHRQSTEVRPTASSSGRAGGSPRRQNTVHGPGTPPTAFPSRFVLDAIPDNKQPDPNVSGFTGKGLLAAAGQVPPNPYSTSSATGPVFEDTSAAFRGRGLLARSGTQRSQGGRASGRGVSGIQGQPLVDMKATSEFADGSLLRKLEAWKGVQ